MVDGPEAGALQYPQVGQLNGNAKIFTPNPNKQRNPYANQLSNGNGQTAMKSLLDIQFTPRPQTAANPFQQHQHKQLKQLAASLPAVRAAQLAQLRQAQLGQLGLPVGPIAPGFPVGIDLTKLMPSPVAQKPQGDVIVIADSPSPPPSTLAPNAIPFNVFNGLLAAGLPQANVNGLKSPLSPDATPFINKPSGLPGGPATAPGDRPPRGGELGQCYYLGQLCRAHGVEGHLDEAYVDTFFFPRGVVCHRVKRSQIKLISGK